MYAVLQTDKELLSDPERSQRGFHMAPFDPEQGPTLLIRPDFFYVSAFKGQAAAPKPDLPQEDLAAREIFQEGVHRAVDAIVEGSLHKVVLTRRFSIPFEEDPLRLFESMLSGFPAAFRYFWYHPDTGIWTGASPEILMTYDGTRSRTVSLAGTQPAAGEEVPDWGFKEHQEQQIVTDYIRGIYREFGHDPEVGPTTSARAGTLWHLQTELSAPMSLDDAGRLVKALHPTPAVCGNPLKAAKEYIRKLENYDREYYCGYVGITGLEDADSFRYFVNLRCAQLRDKKAYIYVGGGITAESMAKEEWQETRLKSRTMLSVLQNIPNVMED